MAMLIWFMYLSMLPASGNKKNHVGVLASHFSKKWFMFWLDNLVLARIPGIQDRFTSRNYSVLNMQFCRQFHKKTSLTAYKLLEE